MALRLFLRNKERTGTIHVRAVRGKSIRNVTVANAPAHFLILPATPLKLKSVMENNVKSSKRRVATLIPYFVKNGKVVVFLQRRTKDVKYRPDQFGFFGGGIEAGETPEQTLIREIGEELSVQPKNYEFLGQYESDAGIRDVFIMEVDEDFKDTVRVNEGQYGRYFTEDEVANEQRLTDFHRKMLGDLYNIVRKRKI